MAAWCRYVMLVAACLLPFGLHAQQSGTSLESDWLQLVKGYRGADGVEVVGVKNEAGTGPEITLAVPKSAIADRGTIEEVVVVGHRPERPDIPRPLDVRFEWVADYDKDRYGLVIRLSEDTQWPIRLYMNSEAGFTR